MIFKKLAAGLTTGALLATMASSAAFAADNTCTITDNGAFSYNKCGIVTVNKKKTVQVNNAFVENNVGVVSSTGGNSAKFNTGGSNTITTGGSRTTVTITNTVNSNTINP